MGTDCLEWDGSTNRDGYGYLTVRRGGQERVHRLAMKVMGHDVTGKVVAHRCDNRKCYRYSHLFITDPAGNSADMAAKGKLKGERHPQATLTNGQAKEIKTMLAIGESCKEIADLYGVSRYVVYDIKRGKTWTVI